MIDLGEHQVYEHRRLHFENFVPDKSGAAEVDTIDSVHSFLASGARATTHQTTFVPLPGSGVLDRSAKA